MRNCMYSYAQAAISATLQSVVFMQMHKNAVHWLYGEMWERLQSRLGKGIVVRFGTPDGIWSTNMLCMLSNASG